MLEQVLTVNKASLFIRKTKKIELILAVYEMYQSGLNEKASRLPLENLLHVAGKVYCKE